MKKLITAMILAAIMTAVVLSGCSNGGAQTSASVSAAAGTAASESASAGTETSASASAKTSASAGADANLTGSVTASGSSALLPLAQDAAEKFKTGYPNVSLTLNAGGSGTGLKQVADGSVDIGNSDVFAEEKLDAQTAQTLVDHKVCVVTMAAIVNNDLASSVSNLTKQQLIDVFSGKITNWKDVGGPDEKVLLVTRPDSSGTRALFTKYALDGTAENSSASYLETDNSGELVETVKTNKGAIGYVALSYLVNNSDVKAISIDGTAPTLENTYSGKYPVWGYEHMYTKGEPNAAVKAFIDFVMSDSYGKQMEALGYGAASKMQVSR